MAADARIALELQRLEGLIAQSGIAERRPEVLTLLAAAGRRAPVARVRGATPLPPSRAKRGAKLATLLRRGLDLATLAGAAWLALALWRGEEEWAHLVAVLIPLGAAWALSRFEALRDGLYEAGFRLVDEAWFAWDWLAEAFTLPAMHRFARHGQSRFIVACIKPCSQSINLGTICTRRALSNWNRNKTGLTYGTHRAAARHRIGPL
jgi:hypothetical protein